MRAATAEGSLAVKILMSAFSCGPGRGSEPGVGWNIAVEAARLGHQVVVLTQSEFASDIDRQVRSGSLPPGLRFDVLMPRWLERLRDIGLRLGQPALTWHITSVLWQFCALRHVRRHYRNAGFDLVHHVTFAGIRHPTLLTLLNVPTVLGPLGGGDRVPMALRKSFPWRYWLAELARDLHNWSLRIDPMTRSAFHRARLIFLRTEAAMVAVPRRDRHKVRIRVGLGVADTVEAEPRPRRAGEPLRLLYAGGLLYLKGVHLGLRALAQARRRGAHAVLTIVGDGPARSHLERLTKQLALEPYVVFKGQVARHELLGLYGEHHVLLFPSMRDAGGMVVLEAWSRALPVICVRLAGPGKMVDESCGRVVSVSGRGEEDCAAALGVEIAALAADDALRLSLGRGAMARYRQCSWRQVVAGLYTDIAAGLSDASGSARRRESSRAGSPQPSVVPYASLARVPGGERFAMERFDIGACRTFRPRMPARVRGRLLGAAVQALVALPLAAHSGEALCPAEAVPVQPGASIQAAVDKAPPGAAFCLKSGVHRMQVVRPKRGQRFHGEGQTVLNGSLLLSGFTVEGPYWVGDGSKLGARRTGQCMKSHPTCNFPNTVMLDDQVLTRVLRKQELGPGRVFIDLEQGRLYLADDPTNRVVEAAAAAFAFASTAPDVLISDIKMEKYASPAQKGAIDAQRGLNWNIQNCQIRLSSSAGISVGRGSRVSGCDIHHNGQIGITGAGNDIRLESNRIWENNTRGFSMGWEAGGAKISLADGVVFRGNHVHDNRGPGLWCDGDCRNVVYEDNVVERNHEAGIYHEISYNAVIRNNTLRHNGANSDGWFWGDDILISASEGVEIYNNRLSVASGRCAIMLIDQGRRDNGRLYKTRNNIVHDNDIHFEGAPCAGGTSDVARDDENFSIITEGNNRFDRNTYRVRRDAGRYRFVWGRAENLGFEDLQAKGLERAGRLIPYDCRGADVASEHQDRPETGCVK